MIDQGDTILIDEYKIGRNHLLLILLIDLVI